MAAVSNLNFLAVGIAALAAFVFGGAYYGALGSSWRAAAEIDPEDAKMTPLLLIVTFLLQLVLAFGFALVLASIVPAGEIVTAWQVAAVGWLGLCFAPMAVNHRYQGLGWDLTVIDALHWLGVFLVMATVLTVLG